jgi:hypothetical protein
MPEKEKWKELYEKYYGKSESPYRKYLILATIIIVTISFIYLMNYFAKPKFLTGAVSLENLQNYDNKTGSIFLERLEGNNCDIYISCPDKRIEYLESKKCESLSATKLSDITIECGNQFGVYYLFVLSDKNETYKISFEMKE